MTDAEDRASVAATAARAGGRRANEQFRTVLEVETKADKNDLVTDADRAAQRAVRDRIHARYPDEPIVGEEDDEQSAVPGSGPAWVVDPIDGTANFVWGMRLWTTSVAALEDGRPVGAATVLPAVEDAYLSTPGRATRNGERIAVSNRRDPETFAVGVLGFGPGADRSEYATLTSRSIERFGDVRRLGSMQTALAFVASGELDAAITTRRSEAWDSIAGVHLIERAGGRVTDLEGEAWRHDSTSLVASNGRAHEALFEVARESKDAE
jgi:myo-inositol-1(or 4)-monophosphatase